MLGGIEGLLEQLGVDEEVKAFMGSVPQDQYRYYLPVIKQNPQIGINELRAIEIPEEGVKVDPYEERERRIASGYPTPVDQWVLVQFRKARKGRPLAEIRDNEEAYFIWWRVKEKLPEIYDWYSHVVPNLASFDFVQAEKASDEWHEAMAAGGAGQIYQEGMNNVVYGPQWETPEWKGWTIRKITTGNDLEVEGNKMNHCVGSYCDEVEKGYSDIYSLRDPKNEPHVTIEASGGTFDITQIMGNSNQEPDGEYKNMIAEWFRQLDGVTLESEAFEDKLAELASHNIEPRQIPDFVESMFGGGDYGVQEATKLDHTNTKELYLAIVRGFMGKHYDNTGTYPYMYDPIDLLAEKAVEHGVDDWLEELADRDLEQLSDMAADYSSDDPRLARMPDKEDFETIEEYNKVYEAKEDEIRQDHYDNIKGELPYSLAEHLVLKINELREERKAA